MKNDRQRRIKELLETENLRTQSEISKRLIEEGFNATQATVSRDLRSLCLNKSGGKKSGTYGIKKDGRPSAAIGGYKEMRAYIVSIKSAMNIVVVKTAPGFAQAIASSVDNQSDPNILGCVAGDDTIIIVAVDAATAEQIVYDTMLFVDEDKADQENGLTYAAEAQQGEDL